MRTVAVAWAMAWCCWAPPTCARRTAAVVWTMAWHCGGSPRLSWEYWILEWQKQGPTDRRVFVGPICCQHVGRHVGGMSTNHVEEGINIVEPKCWLPTHQSMSASVLLVKCLHMLADIVKPKCRLPTFWHMYASTSVLVKCPLCWLLSASVLVHTQHTVKCDVEK
jgi:hypothetical protein